jgi:membrane protein
MLKTLEKYGKKHSTNVFWIYKLWQMIADGLTILRKAVRGFIDDDCVTLSTSISYVFLLALVPFSTLTVYIISIVQTWFFPIHVGWGQVVKEIYTEEMAQMIPFISKEWLIKYVIEARAGLSFKIINLLLLPIISGLLFKTLEVSFRRIFRLPTRHFLLGQLLYAVGSIFLVMFIFLVNLIWGILEPLANHYLNNINNYISSMDLEPIQLEPIFVMLAHTISILVPILFFWIATRIFLNVKVRIRHILISGSVFSLLWHSARSFFGFYIAHVTRVNDLYGSLSSIILILIWIFYSAVVLLFAVEIMNVLHNHLYGEEHQR